MTRQLLPGIPSPLQLWRSLRLWVGVAYALLILTLSSIPGDSYPSTPILSHDKVIHLVEYAGFAFLLAWTRPATASLVPIIIIASLFGMADELYQSFIPGRGSSAADWIADTIGVAVGVYAFQLWNRRR